MQIYDLNVNKKVDEKNNWFNKEKKYFIICDEKEILEIQTKFNFDESTLEECTNEEDKVKFETFEDYDFISLIDIEYKDKQVNVIELNIYVSLNYLILLIPKKYHQKYEGFNKYVATNNNLTINRLYYHLFDAIITKINESLAILEDEIKQLEFDIISSKKLSHHSFIEINDYKKVTYIVSKQTRLLIYISDQLVVNENKFIKKENVRYFTNIEIRMNKVYEFANNLKQLSDDLLHVYDSRQNAKTNEIVTKLTVLTIFFGPLTIITGIYGMNFKYMPELNEKFGYPYALGLMLLVSIITYVIIKRKKII